MARSLTNYSNLLTEAAERTAAFFLRYSEVRVELSFFWDSESFGEI